MGVGPWDFVNGCTHAHKPNACSSFVDYGNAKFEIGNEMRSLDDKSLASSPNWKTKPCGPTLASYLPPKVGLNILFIDMIISVNHLSLSGLG